MTDARLARLEDAFKALADPTRLRILGLLAGGEICVCHIHECVGVPQPTASRHLAYLRQKQLVVARKEGLWVHYSLAPLDEPVMRVVMNAVTHVLSHCESVSRDRERLARKTGCCVPIEAGQRECCAPRPHADAARRDAPAERRRERRNDRRRTRLKDIHTA
jgi:ArsR family transcriptional regulator